MEYRIGWGTADITPRCPVGLIGQFEQRVAREVGSPLTAVAMAVAADGECPTYWVGCDLLFTPASLVRDTATLLRELLPDFDEEQLILSATHIHTGPYINRDAESALIRYTNDDQTLTSPEENRAFTAHRIAAAVVDAYHAMQPSTIRVAVSPIQTGYCRRVTYMDGSAVMYGNVARPDFKAMEYHDGGNTNILYTYDAKGKISGIVANVPCTAQVVEHKEYITSDYWGYTRAYVKARLGDVPVLGVTASAGDLSPRDLLSAMAQEPSNNEEEGAKDLGERIAQELCELASGAWALGGEGYRHLYRTAYLPRWNPTFVEYNRAKTFIEELKKTEGEDFEKCPFVGHHVPGFAYSEAEVTVRRFEEDIEYVPVSIHVVKLGHVVFVTNPFECYIEYADRIKAACPGLHIFDVQLTGDAMGYLATRRAVRGGGYSAMIFNGQCAPEGGDVLVRESVELIRESER
ncbi:MAG: hypothetical protein VB111_06965 [Clostridiaceae bacterium]|nr:hypothetical protein [Clostridiaceae bacterium]